MSLDKPFDNQDNTSKNHKSQPTNQQFSTNSAAFGFGQIKVSVSGSVATDGNAVITALKQLAQAIKVNFDYQLKYINLLAEGALTVPVVFTFDGKPYSLYFIYQEEDVLKYHDLVKHIKHTAYPNLIYFSAIPFPEGDRQKLILQPFKLADLSYDETAIIAGEYAMWWQTPDELTFHDSVTFDYLSKIYEVFRKYETYLHGYTLRQTGLISEENLPRFTLPQEHVKYVLQAPENKKIFLDILTMS